MQKLNLFCNIGLIVCSIGILSMLLFLPNQTGMYLFKDRPQVVEAESLDWQAINILLKELNKCNGGKK